MMTFSDLKVISGGDWNLTNPKLTSLFLLEVLMGRFGAVYASTLIR
jgi:hypothetical protein